MAHFSREEDLRSDVETHIYSLSIGERRDGRVVGMSLSLSFFILVYCIVCHNNFLLVTDKPSPRRPRYYELRRVTDITDCNMSLLGAPLVS